MWISRPWRPSGPDRSCWVQRARSRGWSGRVPGDAPARRPARDVFHRSSLCARAAHATERTGQKIVLHGELADLGVQAGDARPLLRSLLVLPEDDGGTLKELPFP